MRWLVLQLCLVTPLSAAMQIPPEHRVANTRHGVCWWCCAEMIGRTCNIPALVGVRDRIIRANGPEARNGASHAEILGWAARHRVELVTNVNRDYESLIGQLRRGRPVIVNIYVGRRGPQAPEHAVVLWDIRQDDAGKYRVHFVDPNDISAGWTAEWAWFDYWWTGEAYSFPPNQLGSR